MPVLADHIEKLKLDIEKLKSNSLREVPRRRIRSPDRRTRAPTDGSLFGPRRQAYIRKVLTEEKKQATERAARYSLVGTA